MTMLSPFCKLSRCLDYFWLFVTGSQIFSVLLEPVALDAVLSWAHVPLSSIMAVTGHSSEAMLRKYLKLNEVEMGVCAARDLQKVVRLA